MRRIEIKQAQLYHYLPILGSIAIRLVNYKYSGNHAIALYICWIYSTIIPRARMGSESITIHRGHLGSRNNCFTKIQLFGQKYRDKTTLAS